jgi:rfaE bifunctional protein nucleotidyltransferase chain/domain
MVDKIKNKEEIKKIVDKAKAKGKKVIFTNGVFDILHLGHVRYLAQARSFGDVLVVGLNSDESVKRIKGPKRPIFSEAERAEVLSHLEVVDHVAIFSDLTAESLVGYFQPDVYVKGGDYTLKTLPEAKIVASYGGEVRLVPVVEGYSVTGLIKKIIREKPLRKSKIKMQKAKRHIKNQK